VGYDNPSVRVSAVMEAVLSVPAEMADTVPVVAMGDIRRAVDIPADSVVADNFVDSEVVRIPEDSVGGRVPEDRNTLIEVVEEDSYKC